MKNYQNCYINIDEKDIENVVSALNCESISGKGPFVKKYEDALCSYFKAPYALSCSNATAGIHMILYLENIGPGDEVILPPTAPVMSVLPIIAMGASPIFVDNQPNCFNVNLEDLERKITSKTKLLINVPMWGYANNIDEVVKVCGKHKVKVLEDNSHCHGTMLKGQHLGTFGDYAVYSTHERKLITTGEGGFLLVNKKQDYEQLLEIRSFGEVARSAAEYQSIKGAYGYFLGLNFKLSSINAALGITQISKLDKKIEDRRANGEYLIAKMKEMDEEIVPIHSHNEGYDNYYSIVFITNPEKKDQIEQSLLSKGILSDPLRYRYQPLYKMPLFQKYKSNCPNAEKLTRSVFTLPVHEGINVADLDFFLETLFTIEYV